MSRYTTQIRYIVEMNSPDNIPISKKIDFALPLIFDFDYPLWDNNYKTILERKIVLRYFNKEICMETLGLWKLYLEERLNSIMPYYNDLYTTVSNKYNWLENLDISERYTGEKTGKGNSSDKMQGTNNENSSENIENNLEENNTLTGNKTNRSLKSDLPQATFTGVDYGTESQDSESKDNTNNNNKANSISSGSKKSQSTIDNLNNVNTETTTNDIYNRNQTGLNGSKSRTELNLEYRKSIINIDNMIVEELKDLFMMIY